MTAAGDGVHVVVNQGGGSSDGELVDRIRSLLPAAVVDAVGGDELQDRLEAAAAAPATRVLGVAGGDGSVSCAAGIAAAHDRTLLVLPGGTLNHLARDLGVDDVEMAAGAVSDGHELLVDLPRIADRRFVNTASFGAYASLVDERERLEGRLGKWPAAAVAAWRVLRREPPLEVEVDGEPRQLWAAFIGNCRYEPSGFAPLRRGRLDDGRLDVRFVTADRRAARARVVLALLVGRLAHSPVYEQRSVARLVVRCPAGALRLAADGETFDGPSEVEVVKDGTRVRMLVPAT